MKDYQPREGTKPFIAMEFLRAHGQATTVELAQALGCSPKDVSAFLLALREHRMVVKEGVGKGTFYRTVTDDDLVTDAETSANQRLRISIWSDGDVMIEGATVFVDDDNKVVFSRAQAAQLARMLTMPVVQVTG